MHREYQYPLRLYSIPGLFLRTVEVLVVDILMTSEDFSLIFFRVFLVQLCGFIVQRTCTGQMLVQH
jgi:hypothetical protein